MIFLESTRLLTCNLVIHFVLWLNCWQVNVYSDFDNIAFICNFRRLCHSESVFDFWLDPLPFIVLEWRVSISTLCSISALFNMSLVWNISVPYLASTRIFVLISFTNCNHSIEGYEWVLCLISSLVSVYVGIAIYNFRKYLRILFHSLQVAIPFASGCVFNSIQFRLCLLYHSFQVQSIKSHTCHVPWLPIFPVLSLSFPMDEFDSNYWSFWYLGWTFWILLVISVHVVEIFWSTWVYHRIFAGSLVNFVFSSDSWDFRHKLDRRWLSTWNPIINFILWLSCWQVIVNSEYICIYFQYPQPRSFWVWNSYWIYYPSLCWNNGYRYPFFALSALFNGARIWSKYLCFLFSFY